MMKKLLNMPRLSGVVRAPSSKSEAHRHLMVAALAHLYGAGSSPRLVRCTDLNEDIEATVRCLGALGADIRREGEDFTVTPIRRIPRHAVLDCGESGSTLRFLLPVVCALGAVEGAPTDFSVSMVGHGRLPARPLSPLYEELVAHGAILSPKGENPLVVKGSITSGDYSVDGGVSSQFVSGLLFALPLLNGESRLSVTGRIESAPYIDMTLDALAAVTPAARGTLPELHIHAASLRRCSFPQDGLSTVGGDWSGAAFFLAAGVMAPAGQSVTVMGLDPHTRQGDAAIVEVLRRMGGRIELDTDGGYTAYASALHGYEIDAAQIPDLVPILAVVASVAEGETRITGASRLRLKESDRLATVRALLEALGGDVTETADGLIIRGVPSLRGGLVDAAGDHRIAMSAAIAATRCVEPVTICGAEAVAKSYPAFWDDFEKISLKYT